MKKKLFISMMVIATVFSNLSRPIFATDNKIKLDYKNASKITNEAIAYELNLFNDKTTDGILETLLKSAFEYKYSLGFNKPLDENIDLTGFKIDGLSLINNKESKSLSRIGIQIPKSLSGAEVDSRITLDMFLSKDQVGFKMPELFNGFYYADLKTIISDWNNSEMAEKYPIDTDIVKQLDILNEVLNNYTSIQMNKKIIESVNSINKSLDPILNKTFDKAVFTTTKGPVLESKRGYIVTDMISLNISKENANIFLNDFIEYVRNDESLYNYYKLLYSPLDNLFGGDFSRDILNSLADLMEKYEFNDTLVYKVYLNESKHIYSNDIYYSLKDKVFEDVINYSIKFDTKGNDFLLNEIYFDFAIEEDGQTNGFAFSAFGNIVPDKNKIQDFTFDMKTIGENSKGEVTYNEVGKGTYYYDRTTNVDNFKFNIDFQISNQDIDPAYLEEQSANEPKFDYEEILTEEQLNELNEYYKKFNENARYITKTTKESFTTVADIFSDVKENKIAYNFKTINYKSESFDLDFFVKLLIKPTNPDLIKLNDNSKKITDLKLEEYENLINVLSGKVKNLQ